MHQQQDPSHLSSTIIRSNRTVVVITIFGTTKFACNALFAPLSEPLLYHLPFFCIYNAYLILPIAYSSIQNTITFSPQRILSPKEILYNHMIRR